MGLVVSEGETKYMLSASTHVRRIGSQNHTSDIVKEFIYFDFAATTKNDVRSRAV